MVIHLVESRYDGSLGPCACSVRAFPLNHNCFSVYSLSSSMARLRISCRNQFRIVHSASTSTLTRESTSYAHLMKQIAFPVLVINEMKLGDLNSHVFHIILMCGWIRNHVEELNWPKTGLSTPIVKMS